MSLIKYAKRTICATLAVGTLFLGMELTKGIITHLEKIERFKKMSYQEAISEVKTPEEAMWYVRNYMIADKKYSHVYNSFRVTHENRFGDCSEATVAAAALLSDDGYPPTYLAMFHPEKEFGHAVFVYEKDGKWGTIGINYDDNNTPRFANLEEMVRELGYTKYYSDNIRSEIIPDWISTSRNLALTNEEMKRIVRPEVKEVNN